MYLIKESIFTRELYYLYLDFKCFYLFVTGFHLNHIGIVTVYFPYFFFFLLFLNSCRSRVKTFKALRKFISINVIKFQLSNFTINSASGMALSLSSIMTVSVVESTRVNAILKDIVTVPSKLF